MRYLIVARLLVTLVVGCVVQSPTFGWTGEWPLYLYVKCAGGECVCVKGLLVTLVAGYVVQSPIFSWTGECYNLQCML